jgi:hypothetical protein
VAQNDYRHFSLRKLLRGYFGGSFTQLVSFFAQDEKLVDAPPADEAISKANPQP